MHGTPAPSGPYFTISIIMFSIEKAAFSLSWLTALFIASAILSVKDSKTTPVVALPAAPPGIAVAAVYDA